MSEKLWFEPLVWTDYRLFVLVTFLIPLVLLIWAFVQRNEALQRLLAIYWRVSSLLLITCYLMIGGFPLSFLTSFVARILVPTSLWFWIDLNEEIMEQPPSQLKLVFTAWRWAVTLYGLIGALASIPFLSCAFTEGAVKTRFCNVWFDPTLAFKQFFHPNTDARLLGIFGFMGLITYVIALTYFALVRFARQGRSAIEH